MRKLFFSLMCMIISMISASAASYTFQFYNCDGHAIVQYYDASGNASNITSTSSTSFTNRQTYMVVYPEDGYTIESISINAGGSGFVDMTVSDPSGQTWLNSNGQYDSDAGAYVGAWKSRNQITIVTKAAADSRDKSFTVTADNFDDFTLRRNDNSVVELSADNNVVAYSDDLDSRFIVESNGDNDLVSVSVNGTEKTISSNQCIIAASDLSDGAKVDIRTVWPEVNYTFSLNIGTSDPECFSSITINGEEVAYADLQSSYPAGTKIVLTANPIYEFSTFSVSPDPNSTYNASSSKWEFTLRANVSISAKATKAAIYTASITLNGPDDSIIILANGENTSLKNGVTTAFNFKQTQSGYSFYINNSDVSKYKITAINVNGTDLETIEQSSSYANYQSFTTDATVIITTEELQEDYTKITFNFDDSSLVTLYDSNSNECVATNNVYYYAIAEGDYAWFRISPKDTSNQYFKIKKNGNDVSFYGSTCYLYGLTAGDVIDVTAKAPENKYTFDVTINSDKSFSDLFSYVTIDSSTSVSSIDDFESEYLENTQFDFNFNTGIEVESFLVNGTAISPAFGSNYRIKLTENTSIVITAGDPQNDWTLYINVAEPDYVNVRDAANGYKALTLVSGENQIATAENNQYVIDWDVNDGSTMNSIIFNDENITPSNSAQNNVSFTVTADGQHLYINNVAPVAKNDILTISAAGTAYSGNIVISDKDGKEITTIRVDAEEISDQEINFSYSAEAPLTVMFYGFKPKSVICNETEISGSIYTPELADGETGNTTSQVSYVLDNLAEGSNALTLDLSEDTTGISSILVDSVNNGDIYNLQGIRVRRGATADTIKELPAGVYIMNGQKIIKR